MIKPENIKVSKLSYRAELSGIDLLCYEVDSAFKRIGLTVCYGAMGRPCMERRCDTHSYAIDTSEPELSLTHPKAEVVVERWNAMARELDSLRWAADRVWDAADAAQSKQARETLDKLHDEALEALASAEQRALREISHVYESVLAEEESYDDDIIVDCEGNDCPVCGEMPEYYYKATPRDVENGTVRIFCECDVCGTSWFSEYELSRQRDIVRGNRIDW